MTKSIRNPAKEQGITKLACVPNVSQHVQNRIITTYINNRGWTGVYRLFTISGLLDGLILQGKTMPVRFNGKVEF